MKKKLVAGIDGKIYDAVLSHMPNIMTDNKVDRTDECLGAVADHMKTIADYNEQCKGFFQYKWEGSGTLTWQSEGEDNTMSVEVIKKRIKELEGILETLKKEETK